MMIMALTPLWCILRIFGLLWTEEVNHVKEEITDSVVIILDHKNGIYRQELRQNCFLHNSISKVDPEH